MDDVNKLDAPSLPCIEDFYSSLKDKNITQEEYQYCQNVWRERGMSTFRDFLVWYNDLDVGPFVTAVERLQQFYFEKRIDLFKTSVSVPGVARTLLFRRAREAGAEFNLVDEKNRDIHNTIKNGPSIIYHREAVKGKTKIRVGKTCQRVIGFDANALYLWAIGEEMPVGAFVRRRATTALNQSTRITG